MHMHPKTRRQPIALRAVLAVSFFAVASPVFCDTPMLLTDPVTSSEISGFARTPFTLGAPEGTYGVNGVLSMERDHKPCHIASMTEDINDYRSDSSAIKNLCGENATGNRISAGFGEIKFARHTFVRALRVCMNNDNNRVKGFQIRGRVIDANGNVTDLPPRHASLALMSELTDLNAPNDQRLNCDNWEKWVECPESQIVTALTAHFGPGAEPRSVTGIALQCRLVSKGG